MITYSRNGKSVPRHRLVSPARRAANMRGILESRKAPGGHEPYWGIGHESLASGVPPAQAQEHHDWCQSQGLVGVEVTCEGSVVTSSPENRRKYLQARGLMDAGAAGSDSKCLRDRKVKRTR